MTRNNYHIGFLAAGVLLFIGFVLASFVTVVHANPDSFMRKQSAAATTTASFMTPGLATTTLTFDTATGNTFAPKSAVLSLQLLGSTTPQTASYATTTFNVTFEYSQDGVDWYSDELSASAGTTTVLRQRNSGGSAMATTTPTKLMIDVPTPTRFVRAITSLPVVSTATNGAVWAEFIAKKEVQ